MAVLHGTRDETVPLSDSQLLLANSGLDQSRHLVIVDDEHRLIHSLDKMLDCLDLAMRG